MPSRPSRQCRHPPGCRRLTVDGYCDEHRTEHYRRRLRRYGKTSARGLGADHRRIAEQVIAEETHCWRCGLPVDKSLPGRDPFGPTADHVTPRDSGGRTHRNNYRLAHNHCNARSGAALGNAKRAGDAA